MYSYNLTFPLLFFYFGFLVAVSYNFSSIQSYLYLAYYIIKLFNISIVFTGFFYTEKFVTYFFLHYTIFSISLNLPQKKIEKTSFLIVTIFTPKPNKQTKNTQKPSLETRPNNIRNYQNHKTGIKSRLTTNINLSREKCYVGALGHVIEALNLPT